MGLRKKAIQEIEETTGQFGFSSGYDLPGHGSEDMELDILELLKFNVFKLGDLQSRLGFMNDELEKVIGSHRKLDR